MTHVIPPSMPDGARPTERDRSTHWGGLLIVLGALFLIRQLLDIDVSDIVWGSAMVFGGAFFLGAYRRDPASWALLIPGVALVAIGIGRVVSSVAPRLGDAIGSVIVLGGIGIAFLFAYLSDRVERWWAVIPAGALLGLAAGNLVAGLGGASEGWLFIGLGSAFLWLALRTGRTWGLWPAGVLLFIGLSRMPGFLGLGWPDFGPLSNAIWPAALIAVGLWLLFGRRNA